MGKDARRRLYTQAEVDRMITQAVTSMAMTFYSGRMGSLFPQVLRYWTVMRMQTEM